MNQNPAPPLSEAVFFILLSLAEGPLHGYGILKSVQHLSGRRVQLSTGTLYGALKRMMDQDWIARVDDPQPNLTGRERKAYILTQLGRNILKLETSRLQQLLDAAHRHPLAEQA